MTAKTKTLRVSFPHIDHRVTPLQAAHDAARVYRVEQVTDSTAFNPGQFLDKNQVDDLCASREWKVTVVGAK